MTATEATRIYLPMLAPACGLADGIIHAIAGKPTAPDEPTVCGVPSGKVMASREIGGATLAVAWPPPARGKGWGRRCPECWDATGKPRPAREWSSIEPPPNPSENKA